MDTKLVLASNNNHKLIEIRAIFQHLNLPYNVLSLKDIGFFDELPETCDTIEGNAEQKARTLYEATGFDCFADDTGLFIHGLQGDPGVYSARYAGEKASFEDNMNKVLQKMHLVDQRQAYFVTAIALIIGGKTHVFKGQVNGHILTEPHGLEGFGYDPIFCPDGFNQSFAELSSEVKNQISHRAMAVNELSLFLNELSKRS